MKSRQNDLSTADRLRFALAELGSQLVSEQMLPLLQYGGRLERMSADDARHLPKLDRSADFYINSQITWHATRLVVKKNPLTKEVKIVFDATYKYHARAVLNVKFELIALAGIYRKYNTRSL